MAFYSAHNGDMMYYRVSTNAEDISSWDDEKTVDVNSGGEKGYTYANPLQLTDESDRLYLFWRGADLQPTFSSSDDGDSWSPAQTLINVPDGRRPYIKYVSNGVDEIHFVFTDGHPAEEANNSIYYAYYKNGGFYKADGTFIKGVNDLPLTPSEVDTIYDSSATGVKAWVWDIALAPSDAPTIVYATFPSADDHRYRYARWNGTSWVDNEITPAGSSLYSQEVYYSGGVTLDHANPSVVYLSREIDDIFEIEKWTTNDDGASWVSEPITSNSVADNMRPVVPRGYTSGDLGVIWMYGYYPSYTNYGTSIRTTTRFAAGTASIGEAHVRIPSLSSSVDEEIYVYYGNSSAVDSSSPASVWDAQYESVYHLGTGSGTSVTIIDSTGNNRHGSKSSDVGPSEVQGKIGFAQEFDGNVDSINVATPIDMAGWDEFSVEAWVKYSGGGVDEHTIVGNWARGVTEASFLLRIEPAGDYVEGYITVEPDTQIGGGFEDLVLDSGWHKVTLTYSVANGLRARVDDTLSATVYAGEAPLDADSSVTMSIGNWNADAFSGQIDELRVSNVERSEAWLLAAYKNQALPGEFYDVGAEEGRYATSRPSIQPTAANAQAFTSLSSFSATETANGGNVKYQISIDSGSTWNWYDGGWTSASAGYGEASSASDINANMGSLAMGAGAFLFKAFLSSDGTQFVQLSDMTLTYENDSTSLAISAVSATSNNAGTGVTVTWTTDEQASSQVKYGLVSGGGSTFSSNHMAYTAEADTDPRVTDHTVTLGTVGDPLPACTRYHYQVISRDAAGNTATGSLSTFTTVGCAGADADLVITQTGSHVSVAEDMTIGHRDGGTGTGISLVMPAGFASNDMHVQIKRLNRSALLALTGSRAEKTAAATHFYELTALSGTTVKVTSFDAEITVTVTYADADVSGLQESSLGIYRYDSAAWQVLDGCSVDTAANTVTCTTTQFSPFGLFGDEASSDSAITSTADTSTTISVQTQGNGGRRGSPAVMAQRIAEAHEYILARYEGTPLDTGMSEEEEADDGAKPTLSRPTITRRRGRVLAHIDDQEVLFRDVEAEAWYAPYIVALVEGGIAQGYKDEAGNLTGEFGVANPITHAEVLKMALEAAGEGIRGLAPSRNRTARGSWAEAYVAKAEDMNLSLFSTTLDVHSPATRGQVIQTILEVMDIPIGVRPGDYRDLRASHPHAKAIGTATWYGLIHGDTDHNGTSLGTVRPDDHINRAEVAKIIAIVKEISQ